MRVTQRIMVNNLRENIRLNERNLLSLQDQLASGKRLRKPSDDPQALDRALVLRADTSYANQYLRNITQARGWLAATDTSLDQLGEVLIKARDIGVRATTDTLSADERTSLARQMDALLAEAEQAMNTTHMGKYIFAGRQVTGDLPFDVTRTPVYVGDSGVIRTEIGRGVDFNMNSLPSEVTIGGVPLFESVLSTLKAMYDRLAIGEPTTSAQLDDVTAAVGGVTELRGAVGAKQARLDASETALEDQKLSLAANLSRQEDADVAEVMTSLMMHETVYETALQVGARVIQQSLLDYLR